jgi:NAD(P)-dependent dehydrogenase (short-subunit alcohol dehydrogenase family)
MNIRLDGKKAIVTGANSGIGQAIALALADAGAQVCINYRSHPETANEMVVAMQAKGGKALAIEADVSDQAAVAAMFSQVESAWGGIDILVNSAGIDGDHAMSWEADATAWKNVIDINLFGAFNCAQQALRRMTAQQSGVILNISSVHEVVAWSGYSAYTASKAGLSMLSKTLAQEVAPFGVRVLSLAPGAIKTPINQPVWSAPDTLNDLLKKIPLNRMGNVEEIANMAVVLVSDTASYITGTTVFVDGGLTDYPDFAHGG